MKRPISVLGNAKVFGLKSAKYVPNPPEEIDELYYYKDDIPGDGRGLV